MPDVQSPVHDDLQVLLDADGIILEASPSLSRVLGAPGTTLIGQRWQNALVTDEISQELLGTAMACALPVTLPALIVGDAGVFAGTSQPVVFEGEPVCRLVLWSLPMRQQLAGLEGATGADVLALLGVDQLRYDNQWSVRDTASLLQVVREQLLIIVREMDVVSGVCGNTVAVLLRDLDESAASGLCRALLSHLNASIAELEGLRLTVGLTRVMPREKTLQALLRAQRSMLLAQRGTGAGLIRAAEPDDHAFIMGQVLHNTVIETQATSIPALPTTPDNQAPAAGIDSLPPIAPIEKDIEGYVVDNMEGAVDQAVFLAGLDVPVGIVGPAGTGKMYIARIIHEQRGLAPDLLVAVDCREFRSRASATRRVAAELRAGEGRTLVFKSPHMMHPEVQQKLARQIATRTLADASPARYLPDIKFVALFPEPLDALVRRGELLPALASVFAGFPIQVPPIRDRKQAVLRWAHKILGQEAAQRDRLMQGFTPDAERAMLAYPWPGNISEMRLCIHSALDRTDKDWLTPVDLGLYDGIDAQGVNAGAVQEAFLSLAQEPASSQRDYEPTADERLDQALGEAVHDMLKLALIKPLGAWLEDDLVLAVLERYRDDVPKAAAFLHTSARNVRRWLPKIAAREAERTASNLWHKPASTVRDWVREVPPPSSSPITSMQDKLMRHLVEQGGALSSAKRAQVMGVSTPTYLKRLRAFAPGTTV